MTYQPTGKPPGRPRSDGKPAGSVKPKPATQAKPTPPVKPETHPAEAMSPAPPAPGRESIDLTSQGELCKEHWPEGWPTGATGLGCTHVDRDDAGEITDIRCFSWTRQL